MALGQLCQREAVTTKAGSTIRDAARLMRERHVGALVVVEEHAGSRRPTGILTDRDIALEVVARDRDPDQTRVAEVMIHDPTCADEDAGVWETICLMRDRAVRRMPVLTRRGALLGIVTYDDLVGLLADELGALARVVPREQRVERAVRS